MKKKILVVDDEADFAQMVKLNLETTGKFQVRVETHGERAYYAAKDFKPDLVLLDIVMPDVDGPEIIIQMESDKELKDIPVIFLTAIVKSDEVKAMGGKMGGRLFLAKPITAEKLIKCIEENLKKW